MVANKRDHYAPDPISEAQYRKALGTEHRQIQRQQPTKGQAASGR